MKKQNMDVLKEIISGRYARARDNNGEDSDDEKQALSGVVLQKYRTFTQWDIRNSLPSTTRHSSPRPKPPDINANQSFTLGLSKLLPADNQAKLKKRELKPLVLEKPKQPVRPERSKQQPVRSEKDNSQGIISAEQLAVKLDRRERFKKLNNSMHLVQHYIQKEGYEPSAEQKHLIEKLLGAQKSMELVNLDKARKTEHLSAVLQKIYQIMNLAVDYNELLFLSLLILLAADICYYLHDFDRAFYYYNQTRIAGSYAHIDQLKISALMGMGRIAGDLQLYHEAKRIFKKCLQYAWRCGSEDCELEVYDLFGQILHYEGRTRESKLYHARFSLNVVEPAGSALKKISNEMLANYDESIHSLESSNLDSLFIQYLNIPISASSGVTSRTNQKFRNYSGGQSPRLMKQTHDFSAQSFQTVELQLQALLAEDIEFQMDLSEPDGCNDTGHTRRYLSQLSGRKKEPEFQHSVVFNQIMKRKYEKPEMSLKLPLEEQIKQRLDDQMDPLWYENMVSEIKKKRAEKVGTLKERVRNSHLSYHKYPAERRKQSQYSSEKIRESFNRTILDWIDPPL